MLWYLNRCVVNPPSARGKGLGSQALQNMLAQLETTDCEVLVVTPGGYGGDPDDQDAFYTKNGFEAVWQDGEGGTLMIWIPKNKRTTPG
jgi:GNAT superfamily N-acetyltransferase